MRGVIRKGEWRWSSPPQSPVPLATDVSFRGVPHNGAPLLFREFNFIETIAREKKEGIFVRVIHSFFGFGDKRDVFLRAVIQIKQCYAVGIVKKKIVGIRMPREFADAFGVLGIESPIVLRVAQRE